MFLTTYYFIIITTYHYLHFTDQETKAQRQLSNFPKTFTSVCLVIKSPHSLHCASQLLKYLPDGLGAKMHVMRIAGKHA